MKTLITSFALLTAAAATAASLTSTTAPTPVQGLDFPATSPRGTIQQRVGVTDVEVTYSRPSMRGRQVFGGLEPYGNVWRTGANGATRVTFSTDVSLGGTEVPAGSYALLSIPGKDEWTVILNKDTELFGAYGYDQTKDLARITVEPEALSTPVETLTFGFSDLSSSGTATMHFEWETTRIALELDTQIVKQLQPRIEEAMAGDGQKPYVQAAMFYYENGLDLDKAAAWMEKGLEANPDAFWFQYRHGLILAAKGDKKGAIEAAMASMEKARKRGGSVGAEYERLNKELIERCK